MSLAQRYARAAISGNLKNDELHFDTDVLAAMALSSHFGSLAARVKYCNDGASYRRLLETWTAIVAAKGGHRAWPANVDKTRVAYLSLRRWLSAVCPACSGLQRVKLLGAPVLSERECPACLGTGEIPLRCPPVLRDFVLDMVEELDGAVRRSAARASKKLRRPRDDLPAEIA